MAEPFDQGEFKRAAFLPEITLEVYHELPEDVCLQAEVVDGWMVRCESPSYSHQTIAHNLVSLLRDPVKQMVVGAVAGDFGVIVRQRGHRSARHVVGARPGMSAGQGRMRGWQRSLR